MSRGFTLAALALITACSGGTNPAPEQPQGTCSADGSAWSCERGAQPVADPNGPFFLAQCPPAVGAGAGMGGDSTVDTTNPNEPVHISNGDCLQCGTDGYGTYWSCVAGLWSSRGVYTCH